MMRRKGYQISLAALLLCSAAPAELRYRMRLIPDAAGIPGYYFGVSLSNDGMIAGGAWVGNPPSGPMAFISWRAEPGQTQSIGSLPTCNPLYAVAEHINSNGHVVGWDQGANCDYAAFLWTPTGGMIALGDLPGGSTRSDALGINALDQVVGWSASADGDEAFLWDPVDGMRGLGDLPGGQFMSSAGRINDQSWVIGSSCSGEIGCSESFLWTPEDGMIALRDLDPTLPLFDAGDINNAAQIAGTAWIDLRRHGGIWDPQNGLTLFGFLTQEPDEYLLPYDVNDHGVVVGVSWNDRHFGPARPFIWHPLYGLHDISELLDPCSAPPLDTVLSVHAINNAGEMVVDVSASLDGAFLVPYILGDLDEDGVCDLQDLAILLGNFSRVGDASYEDGDLDCDRDVDLQDLAILLSNFGETLP